MKIKKHLLEGAGVTQTRTPNIGGKIVPQYLVLHYTAGRNAKSSIESLCTQKPSGNASAHIVIGRDGAVTQLAPFDIATWHAGVSCWGDLSGMNQYSIGVEMDNAGRLVQAGTKYRAWFGSDIPENDVVKARHKNETEIACWHAYTEAQIGRAEELAELLVREYGLADILGHEDIAPGRKSDPGPAFPLVNIRSAVLGRAQDSEDVYEIAADTLNIRKGPGIEFEPVSAPLLRGTRVMMQEMRDRWSRVDVEGPNDVEGWVCNKFLKKV
jgi:N-acetylmuramoyl-L-alanine amidase